MKLRSSFHDYYDAALAEGQDDTIMYLRYPQEEELSQFPFSRCGSRYFRNKLSVKDHSIGFCGKFYHVLEVNLASSENRDKRKFCYSHEDVDTFIRTNFKPKEYDLYLETEKYSYNKGWSYYETHKHFADFFQKFAAKGEIQTKNDYFKDHPIFVISDNLQEKPKIVFNACLKPFEFYRIFDTYSAFQELSMWLANKAIPMKEIPVMSDEIKIGSHGYDKWSFRKEPKSK